MCHGHKAYGRCQGSRMRWCPFVSSADLIKPTFSIVALCLPSALERKSFLTRFGEYGSRDLVFLCLLLCLGGILATNQTFVCFSTTYYFVCLLQC